MRFIGAIVSKRQRRALAPVTKSRSRTPFHVVSESGTYRIASEALNSLTDPLRQQVSLNDASL
jgi:hypothetical protein